MSQPTERNRLDEEASPYLQQHADNPVNWQPWDEHALSAAAEHEAPIFLSIGYSSCHWCHVMEEESFQDETIAELLNEHFVPIKVDREERPDIDAIYMDICQQVTGSGGWPLSAWLTPDGEPFYVGTYFPPEAKRGQQGFGQLLQDIVGSWTNPDQRADMEERAAEWQRAIENDLETVPDQETGLDDDLPTQAANAAIRGADRQDGGWGRGPKFPHPGRIHLLFRAAAEAEATGQAEQAEEARAVATTTLDAMASGGMFDHVGGGFHRYATDRDWTVPHFEKMAYDNAELPRAYLAGYRATGDDRYADVAARTFEFVERELGHPEGGFFSTLDARSEGESGDQEEGAFYVWTPEEIEAAVDDDLDADLFTERFGVTPSGNFEGRTVLTVSTDVATLAAEHDLDEAEVRTRLERARDQVFEARSARPRPARDEKVLAGWNGLLIQAFAEGGVVLDDPSLAARASDALDFVRDHLWTPASQRGAAVGRLARRYKDGDVVGPGYLEDVAFLARGALAVYGARGDVEALAFARDLAAAIEAEFWDPDRETLYFTPESGEALVARPQELTDQSTPSSTGVAVDVLLSVDHFVDHDRFGTIAATVLETHAADCRADPLTHATLTLAADRFQRGAAELTVAAEGGALDWPSDWRETLADTYVAPLLMAPRPPAAGGLEPWLDVLGLDAAPPIWADRAAADGEPTVYACRSFTCSPPTHDLAEALAWLADNAGT